MKDNEIITWAVIGIVILVFLGGIGMMGFQSYGFRGMGGMMFGQYGAGLMFFGWIYGILVLVALVLFIIWIAKKIQKE